MPERGQWSNKAEFVLAVAGNIVGLGNIWRFPYLCFKNGGGAFLVPYFLFAVICGIPLFVLDSSIGQYTKQGVATSWGKLCPLAEGIGYSSVVIVLFNCLCYNILLAWSLFYLIASLSPQLPWISCNNDWNTGHGGFGVYPESLGRRWEHTLDGMPVYHRDHTHGSPTPLDAYMANF